MFNSNFIPSVFIVIFLLTVGGCAPSSKKKINDCLNIQIPDNSRDFEYYKYTISENYNRPYNIYIRFKVDSIGIDKIIRETKLISYESDFKKYMCLENVDKLFIKKLWDFNFIDIVKNKISWRDQVNKKNIAWYSSFYRENGINKIVNCYVNEWDGYILLGYNKGTGDVYILIQVLMKD